MDSEKNIPFLVKNDFFCLQLSAICQVGIETVFPVFENNQITCNYLKKTTF